MSPLIKSNADIVLQFAAARNDVYLRCLDEQDAKWLARTLS